MENSIFQQTQMRNYYRNSENFAEALIIAESIIRLHHNHPVEHWICDGNAGIFRYRMSAALPSCRRKRNSKMRNSSKSLSKNEKINIFSSKLCHCDQEFCCTTFFQLKNFSGKWKMFVYLVRWQLFPSTHENLRYRSRCWEQSSGRLCTSDHHELWATHCPG